MSNKTYTKLFSNEVYNQIIEDTKKIINNRFYNKKEAGRPLKLKLDNIVKAIIYVLITGCQWRMLPTEFGNHSTIYKHFQKYTKANILGDLWTHNVFEYQSKDKYKRKQKNLSIDCMLIKSIGGQDMIENPCDRGRNGTKISAIVESAGVPLSIVASTANIPDHKLVQDTIDSMIVRTKTSADLYADKGYSHKVTKELVSTKNMKLICQNKKNVKVPLFKHNKKVNTVRYVVEAFFGWTKQFRRLILRYDGHISSYLSFFKLACAVIIRRKINNSNAR